MNGLMTYVGSKKELLHSLVVNRNEGFSVGIDEIEYTNVSTNVVGVQSILVVPSEQSTLNGSIRLRYSKVDIGELLENIITPVRGIIDKQYIINMFLTYYAIQIEEEDFDLILPTSQLELPKAMVEFKKESVVFKGSKSYYIYPNNFIGDYLIDNDINFIDPVGKINAYIYSKSKVFTTPTQQLLDSIPSGVVIDTSNSTLLIDYLTATTGDQWVLSPNNEAFNLLGAIVLFNGPVDTNTPPNIGIMIHLSNKCTNLSNNLIISP